MILVGFVGALVCESLSSGQAMSFDFIQAGSIPVLS